MHHLWFHLIHGAQHQSRRGNHKGAGLMYVIIGFFTAPLLIGIPIMLYGFCKLMR